MDFKKYLACEFVPLYHLKTLNISGIDTSLLIILLLL